MTIITNQSQKLQIQDLGKVIEISLSIAIAADLDAVNKRYEEVDFVSSHDGELIVLASYEGKTVGQGRVSTIDTESGELGGIYVY